MAENSNLKDNILLFDSVVHLCPLKSGQVGGGCGRKIQRYFWEWKLVVEVILQSLDSSSGTVYVNSSFDVLIEFQFKMC